MLLHEVQRNESRRSYFPVILSLPLLLVDFLLIVHAFFLMPRKARARGLAKTDEHRLAVGMVKPLCAIKMKCEGMFLPGGREGRHLVTTACERYTRANSDRWNGMSSAEIDTAVLYSEFQHVCGMFTIWWMTSPSGRLHSFYLLFFLLVSTGTTLIRLLFVFSWLYSPYRVTKADPC